MTLPAQINAKLHQGRLSLSGTRVNVVVSIAELGFFLLSLFHNVLPSFFLVLLSREMGGGSAERIGTPPWKYTLSNEPGRPSCRLSSAQAASTHRACGQHPTSWGGQES